MSTIARLTPFLRPSLDILFVALNPPVQSNANGHYFSGKQSRFFDLLYRSGLITNAVEKATADEIVFGGTSVNHKNASFGIVDLVGEQVETKSARVKPSSNHIDMLLSLIEKYHPRFVCIIHSAVRKALDKTLDIQLQYGENGRCINGCDTIVFLNYFPNGNAIPDEPKLAIFGELKRRL